MDGCAYFNFIYINKFELFKESNIVTCSTVKQCMLCIQANCYKLNDFLYNLASVYADVAWLLNHTLAFLCYVAVEQCIPRHNPSFL